LEKKGADFSNIPIKDVEASLAMINKYSGDWGEHEEPLINLLQKLKSNF
jgi:hypothetical protein